MDDEFDGQNSDVSISSFTTREKSGSKVGIEYDFEAISNGTDLDSATVVLKREPDGVNEGEHNHDLSGTQDGVKNAKLENLGSGQDYTLILTVYDTAGNEVSETRTQTAN